MTPAAARPSRTPAWVRSAQRGFTVIELVVALALSTIVLGVAIGLFGALGVADRASGDALQGQVELARTHRAVQRAMNTLLAAPPLTEDELNPNADADDVRQPGEPISLDDPEEGFDAGAFLEDAGRDSLTAFAAVDPDEPPYFELYFEELPGAPPLPRLELVTSISPVRPTGGGLVETASGETIRRDWLGSTRGAFVLVQEERPRRGDEPGWSLVYAPIDPPGEPTVLIERVRELQWSALPADAEVVQWSPIWGAYLEEDYPAALRLIVESETGARADWIFEPAVATEGRRWTTGRRR